MWIRRKNLVKKVSIFILLMVFVAGCRKMAIYHNLTEEETNEIMVVLYESGINARKEKEIVQNEVFWNVTVEEKNLAEARKILLSRNLPRKRELGLSGVYKEKGLIPTPDEQKARFLLAMKGEIVNSLESIPEVVDADVVINIPTPEEFATGGEKRPAASVTLKVKPEGKIISQLTESKVQQFVANAVENLNPRDVSVIISYITPPPEGTRPGEKLILPETVKREALEEGERGTVSVAGINVLKDSSTRLKVYLFIFFTLLIVMSAVLIVNVVRTTRMKQEFKALGEGGERPLLEGEVAESAPELPAGESGGESGEET